MYAIVPAAVHVYISMVGLLPLRLRWFDRVDPDQMPRQSASKKLNCFKPDDYLLQL